MVFAGRQGVAADVRLLPWSIRESTPRIAPTGRRDVLAFPWYDPLVVALPHPLLRFPHHAASPLQVPLHRRHPVPQTSLVESPRKKFVALDAGGVAGLGEAMRHGVGI